MRTHTRACVLSTTFGASSRSSRRDGATLGFEHSLYTTQQQTTTQHTGEKAARVAICVVFCVADECGMLNTIVTSLSLNKPTKNTLLCPKSQNRAVRANAENTTGLEPQPAAAAAADRFPLRAHHGVTTADGRTA